MKRYSDVASLGRIASYEASEGMTCLKIGTFRQGSAGRDTMGSFSNKRCQMLKCKAICQYNNCY